MIKFIKKIFGFQKNDVAFINDHNEIITEIITADSEIISLNLEADSNEVNVNAESIDLNASIPIIFNQDCLRKEFKENRDLKSGIFPFYSWQVKEGEWVEVGTPLFEVCVSKNSIKHLKDYRPLEWSSPVFVSKSGVIEYLKNSGDIIENGDIIGYIHPIGVFENENVVTNKTYCYYFNINKFDFSKYFPKQYLHDATVLYDDKGLLLYFRIKINTVSWLKNNFEYVKKGDLIFSIEFENASFIFNAYVVMPGDIFKNGVVYHYAEKEGYIDINKNGSDAFNDMNQIIYKIHCDYNQLLISKFKNEPQIQVDEFNDSVKINWNVVGGYVNHYETATNATIGGVILNTDDGKNFIFSFESYDNKDYLVFYYSVKDYKLAVGDKVSFLFEDNLKHTFTIVEKSSRSKIVDAKLYETKVQITKDELQIFSEKNLLKWKIESLKDNTSIISDAKNFYWYSNDLHQIVVKNLAIDYLELVSKYVVNHSPLNERTLPESISGNIVEECYVYLMIDTTNNFHKIGISNNPKYREKTLQSDKPTIELLHKKSFPNRKIAEILEKTLHQTYANKRIRGEWFELDSYEINEIIVLLD